MSEFKVDKLGYYKQRNENIVKVVHFHKSRTVLAVDNNEDECVGIYYINGGLLWSKNTEYDLVEYLGEELPKPREFKFEAYLGEWYDVKYMCQDDILDVVFGHGITSNLYKTKKEVEVNLSSVDKISKWEISMKEIID